MGDKVNDDFLTHFQRSPRLEFTETLYKKINGPTRLITLHRFKLSMGIVIALLALTVIFVPQARAAVQSVIHKIAGIYFDEVTESPIACDPMKCLPEEATQTLTLKEAQAAVPFTFSLPTWTPEGYWLNPRVKLDHQAGGYTQVRIEWLKTGFTQEDHKDYIQQMTLTIWQDQGDYPVQQVGVESISEVEINGQPAALIHGAWEVFNKNWNNGATQITWVKDGLRYFLMVGFIEPATVISDEDVIRIAESIP